MATVFLKINKIQNFRIGTLRFRFAIFRIIQTQFRLHWKYVFYTLQDLRTLLQATIKAGCPAEITIKKQIAL